MNTEAKLQLIEQTLGIEPASLQEATPLADVPKWDSLSILNLQIELTAHNPDITFDALRDCDTVADVIALF